MYNSDWLDCEPAFLKKWLGILYVLVQISICTTSYAQISSTHQIYMPPKKKPPPAATKNAKNRYVLHNIDEETSSGNDTDTSNHEEQVSRNKKQRLKVVARENALPSYHDGTTNLTVKSDSWNHEQYIPYSLSRCFRHKLITFTIYFHD